MMHGLRSKRPRPYSITTLPPSPALPASVAAAAAVQHTQVAACQGSEGDATPFTDVKVDDVSEELHKRGYQRYGWEVRG